MRIHKKIQRLCAPKSAEQIDWFNKRFEEMKNGEEETPVGQQDSKNAKAHKRIQTKHTKERGNTETRRPSISVCYPAFSALD